MSAITSFPVRFHRKKAAPITNNKGTISTGDAGKYRLHFRSEGNGNTHHDIALKSFKIFKGKTPPKLGILERFKYAWLKVDVKRDDGSHKEGWVKVNRRSAYKRFAADNPHLKLRDFKGDITSILEGVGNKAQKSRKKRRETEEGERGEGKRRDSAEKKSPKIVVSDSGKADISSSSSEKEGVGDLKALCAQMEAAFPVKSSKRIQERREAVLYGQALGDGIGMFTEFTTKEGAGKVVAGEPMEFSKRDDYIARHDRSTGYPGHIKKFPANCWTDDTDQAICLMRAYHRHVHSGKAFAKCAALEIYRWRFHGGIRDVEGHGFLGRKNARCAGLGSLVKAVVEDREFRSKPLETARNHWSQGDKPLDGRPAANGAIMRTSYLAAIFYDDLEKLIDYTKEGCKVTHADPRCIASCVALNVAIALFLRGYQDSDEIVKYSLQAAQQVFKEEALQYPSLITEEEIQHYSQELEDHIYGDLDFLDLDEGYKDKDKPNRIGYTYKCVGAAFYALQRAGELLDEGENPSDVFRQVIEELALEGGDADTNCAPAGALVAAFLKTRGHGDIFPPTWRDSLADREVLGQCLEFMPKKNKKDKKNAHG